MSEMTNVDAARAQEMIQEGALLLDVREDDEWDAGHAANALHVALSSVPDVLGDLPRDRVIVCVCRSGGRSARAGNFLTEQGFDVVNLEGGMTAWRDSGLELVSDEGEPAII
jgi:rhodanese-related sulfurtransferase